MRPGASSTGKFWKNLDNVVVISVLFEQFLYKILFNFFALNSDFFTNMMHFVPTFSIVRAQSVRFIATQEVQS